MPLFIKPLLSFIAFCHKIVRRSLKDPEKHRCGITKCPICKEYVQTDDHPCYMQPVRDEESDVDVTKDGYEQLLFFDFECRQENGNHEPNLCLVRSEAGDEWVFEGDNTQNEFCEWLFQQEQANCVVMAHNFQGYHSYFILQFLRENEYSYGRWTSLTCNLCKSLTMVIDICSCALMSS